MISKIFNRVNPVRNLWYVCVLEGMRDGYWYTECVNNLDKRLKNYFNDKR